MIAYKAYYGTQLGHRAYWNGQVVWDFGSYTRGQTAAAMLGFAMAQIDTLRLNKMDAAAKISVRGAAHTQEVIDIRMSDTGHVVTVMLPGSQEVENIRMNADSVFHAFAAGYTYGIVFSRGVAEAELLGAAMPRASDIVYGHGAAQAVLSGRANGSEEDLLQLVLRVCSEIDATGSAKAAEPERVSMGANMELTATARADVRSAWIDPVQTGKSLYIKQVYSAVQTGNSLKIQ